MRTKRLLLWVLPIVLLATNSFKATKMQPYFQIESENRLQKDTPGLDTIIVAIDSFQVDSSMVESDTLVEEKKYETIYGTASYYHNKFEGRRTANGAIFRQNKLTAAHRTIPLGTRVRVTSLVNGRVVEVLVNDRMGKSRHEIDLTTKAAKKLKMIRSGWAKVKIEILD